MLNHKMGSLKPLLFFIVVTLEICSSNSQGFANHTGTNVRETGVVFTVQDTSDDNVHILQLTFTPYYDAVPARSLLVPGWQFNSQNLDFLSVAVDYKDKNLFLFERLSGVVFVLTGYNAPVKETINGSVYRLHVGMSNGNVQLAYDWLSKTLYFVDSALKWIGAFNANMTKQEAEGFPSYNLFKIIIEGDLQHPEGVAVDPLKGYLFFSDNGRHPKIERASLDGSNRKTYNLPGLVNPESLAVDLQTERVYWVDAFEETVEFMNYDGTNLQSASLLHGTLLADLKVFRDMLIVTDSKEGEAYFVNKTTGQSLWRNLLFRTEYLFGVVVYNNESQPTRQYSGSDCTELNCDHICVSTSPNPKCMCYDGYVLNTTTNKCDEDLGGRHKALVFATKYEICIADLRALNIIDPVFQLICTYSTLIKDPEPTTTPAPTTTTTGDPNATTTTTVPPPPYDPATDPINIIRLMDLDIQRRHVYLLMEDNSIYRRPIDSVRNDTYREFVAQGPSDEKIIGMVFDWVNQNNLYWMSETALYRKDIVGQNAVEQIVSLSSIIPGKTPHNFVMLHRNRRLAFWAESDSGVFELTSVDLQGQNNITHVTGLAKVRDMVNDDEMSRLFWLQDNYVYSFNYAEDEAVPEQVVNTQFSDYELLLAYKNYVAWAYPTQFFGTYIETYQFDANLAGSGGYLDRYFIEWKVLDSSLAPLDISKHNPCSNMNGGCQQICLNLHNGQGSATKTCRCTTGFTLNSDGLTCNSEYVEDNFALVEDDTFSKVYQIDLATNTIHPLNFKESATINSVFYDRLTHQVVFSETSSSNVYSAPINATAAQIIDNRAENQPGMFALDETTGHLYYADNFYPLKGLIRVLTKQGVGFEFLADQINYEDVKSAIDVHPQNGHIYIGVTSNYRPSYIIRANLDGSIPQSVYLNSVTDVRFPVLIGMVIDHTNNHVYWSEETQQKIFRCDVDFTTCEEFYSPKQEAIRHLDVDGEYLYYTSRKNRHIKRIRLSDKQVTIIADSIELGKLETISVYRSSSPNTQAVNEACRDRDGRGNCSTICFPKAGGRRCACEGNITLKEDERTCTNVFQCDPFFTEVGSSINVSVAFECLRYVNDTCDYYCSGNNAPRDSNNYQLKCTGAGWDRQLEQNLCKSTLCPQIITNGRITEDCMYASGDACNYECNVNYYKNPFVQDLACLGTGAWDSAGNTACIDTYCPTTVTNGQIDPTCNRRVSSTCGYTCNANFEKSTSVTSLLCQQSGSWNQSTGLCTSITCPTSFDNIITINCERGVGASCEYVCTGSSTPNTTLSRLVCLATGSWNQTASICIASEPTVTSGLGSSSTSATEIGLGIMVALLALVIIVIILLAFIFRRRLGICERKDSNIPRATFTNEPIDGIENPGYLNSAISVTNDMYDRQSMASEGAYSTISERSSKPFKNQEQLPDKKEIDNPKADLASLKSDATYVTADDWIKQQNNPDYKY